MKLRLVLDDVVVLLKIKDYEKEDTNDCSHWCKVDISLNSRYINYTLTDAEILDSGEVKSLEVLLGKLMSGTLEEDKEIAFYEPDLEFKFRTAKRLYSEPSKVIYRAGYKDVDIDADLRINFWCEDGCLGGNYFSMMMDRTDLYAMHKYLQLVTAEIKETDPEIVVLLEKNMIIPD